jgi:hypothetical protein
MLMEMKTSVDTLTTAAQKNVLNHRTLSPDSSIVENSPKTPYLPAPGPGMKSTTPESEESKSPNVK